MSAIKALLKKQESEFISLRELLEQMSREGGATPQEAAIFLQRQFESVERDEDGWTPPWYERGNTGWDQTGSRPWQDARVTLSRIVETGDLNFISPSRAFEEMSDDIPF